MSIMRITRVFLTVLCLVTVCGESMGTTTEFRPQLKLSNVWECYPVISKNKPKKQEAPTKDYFTITLPENKFWLSSDWSRYDIKWASQKLKKNSNWCWYRQSFRLPANFQKEKIYLQLNGVYFQYFVWLNGKAVGQNEHGYFPYAMDITASINLKGPNELLILVGDARTLKNAPTGSMSRYERGLFDNIIVYSVNKTHIDDVFVKTSFRQKNIDVELQVLNPQKKLKYIVHVYTDKGKRIPLQFKYILKKTVKGIEKTILRAKWKHPQLWSPETPYLYNLYAEIIDANGKKLDARNVSFGFREFWIKENFFYLNGKKTQLKCQWGHIGEWIRAYRGSQKNKIKEKDLLENLKRKNINIVRYHCQPFPKYWLDAADKTGIMVIAETALNHGPMSNKSKEHVRRFIKRYRNHPSIVIWSLNNEFAHWLNPRSKSTSNFLYELEKISHKLDSSRPVQHSGYGILNKNQETINVHYPVGKDQLLLPNCFEWMRTGKYIREIYKSHPWEKNKPLLIGEQLLPWGGEMWSTLAGDAIYKEPYNSLKRSRIMANTLAQIYRMMVENGRRAGIAMMSVPGSRDTSSPYHQAKAYIFDPVDGFLINRGLRFWSEEKAKLKYFVWNDGPGKLLGKLNWTVNSAFTPESGSRDIKIKVGNSREYELNLKAEKVNKVSRSELNINMAGKDGKLIDQKYPISVLPANYSNIERQGVLFVSKHGKEINIINQHFGVKGKNAEKISFELLQNVKLLIISGLLLPKLKDNDFKVLNEYCQKGGKLILLASARPKNENYAWLPIPLSISQKPLSITFPRIFSRTLFEQMDRLDLRFWRDNNIVAAFAFNKPAFGNFIPLCDAGSSNGMSLTTLIEMQKGAGTIWVTSYSFMDKFSKDPAAMLLMSNLISYALKNKAPAFKKTLFALSGNSSNFLRVLKKYRLKVSQRKKQLTYNDIAETDLIVSDGKSIVKLLALETARRYLKNGKTIYIHILGAKQKSWLEKLSKQPIRFLKYKSSSYIPDLIISPLVKGVSISDLAWGNPKNQDFSPIASWRLLLKNSKKTKQAFEIPGLLFAIKSGDGQIIIDQLKWDTEDFNSSRALRFGSQLLNNIGIEIHGIPYKVLSDLKYYMLDLSSKYNSLFGLCSAKNAIKYFDSVKASQAKAISGLSVVDRNAKMLTFKYENIPFKLKLKKYRSISVSCKNKEYTKLKGVDNILIPRENSLIENIYFFHIARTNWHVKLPRYTNIGRYRINYYDGSSEEIELIRGINIAHFRNNYPDGLPQAKMVLKVEDNSKTSCLLLTVWRNPFPFKKIASIDLLPGVNLRTQPFLLAVTLKASDIKYE